MSRNILITGGAGFIGSNYAARCIARGERVTIFDNLSRSGASLNLNWLKSTFGSDSFRMVVGDVRNADEIREAAADAETIVHLAGQVAVTTSVMNPREDFDINAMGTFNVLEAARASRKNPAVLYASTNKVYGGMEEVRVEETPTQYRYVDFPLGIPETQPLDFHSPYGCSKGSGDQYVRDYHRIYGLPTVVLRQSCIYGTRQFGVEDQGWVAWFVIAAVSGRPITIYGDGKQVRDVLFVEDLMNVYDAALGNLNVSAGQVYNVGGGPANTMSIWLDFEPILERLLGRPVPTSRGDWRPGDQRIYVSDIRKAKQELNWAPQVGVSEGVERLYRWVMDNRNLF
ncbi:NAD-dependent epimerase/dehydratase family protein [bacterium]|nr:NAD-dependent epimerase/dehydratase family protein [bacterium]